MNPKYALILACALCSDGLTSISLRLSIQLVGPGYFHPIGRSWFGFPFCVRSGLHPRTTEVARFSRVSQVPPFVTMFLLGLSI